MLQLVRLSAGYHGGTVLHRVDLAVAPGTVHALVGHNGAGKTTLVHTVAGLLRPAAGRVLLDGRDITGLAPHRRAHLGVGLIPQGRRVFASLTVAEHLAVAYRRGPWDPAAVLDLLPHLAARYRHRAATLSGGEQQMVAIARALLGQPRLLLLDEPTEGLAPRLVAEITDALRRLAADGLTLLLTASGSGPPPIAAHTTVLAHGRTARHPQEDHHDKHPDPPRVRLQQQLLPGR